MPKSVDGEFFKGNGQEPFGLPFNVKNNPFHQTVTYDRSTE
jgi:hypothetical protein